MSCSFVTLRTVNEIYNTILLLKRTFQQPFDLSVLVGGILKVGQYLPVVPHILLSEASSITKSLELPIYLPHVYAVVLKG